MTDDIEKVNWTQFEPYAGLELDLPSVLRDVLSADSGTRSAARELLEDWPYEGYGRIGAMPDVIQILVRLFQAYPDYGDKAALLQLIMTFAAKAPEYAAFTKWYRGDPAALVAAIRRAFAQGDNSYGAALSDADPCLRTNAAKALALLGSAEYCPLLVSQLGRENDSDVCQAILASLGELRAESALSCVVRFLSSTNQQTRLRAAGAICQIAQPLLDRAFRVLVDCAMNGTEADGSTTKEQAQTKENLATEAFLLIAKLGEEALLRAADSWIAEMKKVEMTHLVSYVHRLLAWTMRQAHERSSPLQLSKVERKVLIALADCSHYWTITSYPRRDPGAREERMIDASRERSYLLETLYGLPKSQDGITQLLHNLDDVDPVGQ